jgi:ribosomal protein S18 acetylase RimI-like enzyme
MSDDAGTRIEVALLRLVDLSAIDQLMPLILLADESPAAVADYLPRAEVYAMVTARSADPVGVIALTDEGDGVWEIKNIAVMPAFQGLGIGGAAIATACALARQRGARRMLVGTANCALRELAFYQRAGFRFDHIVRDFFTPPRYPEPIVENGLRAIDMVVLSRDIT